MNDSYVEVLEVMGDDLTVVNAARVSFHKEAATITERDEKLIHYLANHNHISPFFHPQIRFRIKMPIFVAREWYRHTIGLARNEVSRRYVDEPPEFYIPGEEDMRARDPKLKQGSKPEAISDAGLAVETVKEACAAAKTSYETLLVLGVAPEVARMVLPQNMMTEFIETGSLAAYARICKLRLDPQAQKEIQYYAQRVSSILAAKFPVSWAALMMN